MQVLLSRMPPTTSSRDELELWLCKAHNHVNERIGKPAFPCSLSKLNERWREGDKSCDGDEDGHFGQHS